MPGQQRARTSSGSVGVEQAAGRQVDRDAAGRGRPRRHVGAAAQRAVQHVQGQRPDQAGVLGQRDELVRRRRARASGGASGPAPRRRRPGRSPGRPWAGRRTARSPPLDRRRAGRPTSASRRGAVLVVARAGRRGRRCGLLGRVHGDVGALEQRRRRRRRARARGRCRCWPATSQRAARRSGSAAPARRRARRPTASARPPASPAPGSSTANSSPPSRATVPRRRSRRCSRSADLAQQRSPMSWPSASLTSLNRSRSSSSTATGCPRRAARRRAAWKRCRLGRPVSGSCSARCSFSATSWRSWSTSRALVSATLGVVGQRLEQPHVLLAEGPMSGRLSATSSTPVAAVASGTRHGDAVADRAAARLPVAAGPARRRGAGCHQAVVRQRVGGARSSSSSWPVQPHPDGVPSLGPADQLGALGAQLVADLVEDDPGDARRCPATPSSARVNA